MPLPSGLPPRFTLTPERKRRLMEVREVIAEAEERIQLAREANIDVTESAERLQKLKNQTEGILRVYGKV
jgi:hypothetical protein